MLAATATAASAQIVPLQRARPVIPLQNAAPLPPPPAVVHFDDVCTRVTKIGAGGPNFGFSCQLQNGQTNDYRVANYEDENGSSYDIGQSTVGVVLQNVAQEIRLSQHYAGANSNISQIVATFLLFKQANPASQKAMVIRGIYSIDPTPANTGARVVQVVYFSPD
ncbi:MAG: hypothetical protein ACXWLB_17060 [Reyranella sp.]